MLGSKGNTLLSVGIIYTLSIGLCYSQDSRIPVEVFGSKSEIFYQHIIIKKNEASSFSFFNQATCSLNRSPFEITSYFIHSLVLYESNLGFSAGVGAGINRFGVFLSIGILYGLDLRNFRFTYFPILNIQDQHKLLNRLIFEYDAKYKNKVTPYVRVQIITTTSLPLHTTFDTLSRIGIGYKQLRIGIGTPWMNPFKEFRTDRIGFFLSISF